MDRHIKTLEKLMTEGPVNRIDHTSTYELSIIDDLLQSQYIDAKVHRPINGTPSYFIVKVNLNGRELLAIKNNNSEDVIDIKPNFMGLGVNLNALYRKVKHKIPWYKK